MNTMLLNDCSMFRATKAVFALLLFAVLDVWTITPSYGQNLPNLVPTPYQFTFWTDPIIVSTQTSATSDSSSLTSQDSLYVSWAVKNSGTLATPRTFTVNLLIDGTVVDSASGSCGINQYLTKANILIGKLSAGQHKIKIIADSTGVIQESNESDNSYEKTVTIGNPLGASRVTIGPATLSFGNVQIGSSSEATFVIQHVTGTLPASGTVSLNSSQFSIVSGDSFSIANGGAASVTIRFTPTTAAAQNGSASISTSASANITSVAVTGTGMNPPPAEGAIQVRATLNGEPWAGGIKYSLNGPTPFSGDTVPADFQNRLAGSYGLILGAGGPSAYHVNTSPDQVQVLTGGGALTYTINFKTVPRLAIEWNLASGKMILRHDPIPELKHSIISSPVAVNPRWEIANTTENGVLQFDPEYWKPASERYFKIKTEYPAGIFSFPLIFDKADPTKELGPYTATINSIFDHSNPNYSADNIVVAFTGETGRVLRSSSPAGIKGIFTNLFAFSKSNRPFKDGDEFIVNGNYRKKSGGELKYFLWYDGHTGYDYPVQNGTDVFAAADGTVVQVVHSESDFDNNQVAVDHGNGYTTYYEHFSKTNIAVGSKVFERKTKLGETGNGHLHFTVMKGAWKVDPYGWEGPGNDPSPIDGIPGRNNINLWKEVRKGEPTD